MPKNIFITGATGQIGSQLTKALIRKDYKITCLVRNVKYARKILGPNVKILAGDITEKNSIDAAIVNSQTVFHLAALSSYWPRLNREMRVINTLGTANLLDSCAQTGVETLIYTSSIATLGWLPEKMIGNEKTSFNWFNQGITYFETKYEAEQMVLADPRIKSIVVNPGFIFGPGSSTGARMMNHVASGAFGYPKGSTTAAVLDDVVEGHIAAMDRGRFGQRYILGGTPISFKNLFKDIAKIVQVSPPHKEHSNSMLTTLAILDSGRGIITGKEPKFTLPLAKIMTKNRKYSSDKAKRELNYNISHLSVGLISCWEWYKEKLLAGKNSTYKT